MKKNDLLAALLYYDDNKGPWRKIFGADSSIIKQLRAIYHSRQVQILAGVDLLPVALREQVKRIITSSTEKYSLTATVCASLNDKLAAVARVKISPAFNISLF